MANKREEQMQEKIHLEKDDLILKISGSMGSEYSYSVITNWTEEQLLEALEEYQQMPGQDKADIETFLSEKEAVLIPWYDSNGYEAEFPLEFYDLEYDYDTGITVAAELPAREQAEMLMKKEEYGETMLFNDEERNLIMNYAFKLNNMEDTKLLISEMHEAIDAPDLRAVGEVMRAAQAEIDALPDSMVGISEMYEFGYTSNLMLPITKGRAWELFRNGCEVFHLYSDDTEAVVEDEADFDTVDDFYGIEKAAWEKYRLQENDRGIVNLRDAEEYQGVEFFDIPALFSNGRVDVSSLPEGIYRYELQGADYDPGYPLYVKESVLVNHAGTILTAYPLEIPEQGSLRLGSGLNFSRGMQNIPEYRDEMRARNRETDMEIMGSAVIREDERILLTGGENRYGIYQIQESTKGREYLFMNLDFVNSHDMRVDAEHYAFIYGGKLSETDTLDSLYERFNLNQPEGYYGHSLSVSDVVVLQKEGQAKAYYVDSFGFRELPDFVRQRMHEAEMNRKREDSLITLDTTGVEIEQHEGLWHTVDKREIEGEIFYLMRHNEYGDSVAAVIVNSDGELVAQELEHGFDHGAMESIHEFLADRGIDWKLEGGEIPANDTFLPVYRHSLTYAMEHGEVDTYLDSRKSNIDCKNAIEEAISKNFDGMVLNQDVVNPVLDGYGAERVSFVLACTLQNKPWDGRFSRENKEWANNIPIPENVNRGVDSNLDYVVESHPAVLDGFINLAKQRIAELENVQGKEDVTLSAGDITNPDLEQPFISRYYVVNDAYGTKAEQEYQYFTDIYEAIHAYGELSNHLDKQLGMEDMEQSPSRIPLINCKNGIDEMEDIDALLGDKSMNKEVNNAYNRAQFYLDNRDTDIVYELPDGKGYCYIQTNAEGWYDFTFYDKEYQELDGGAYEETDMSIREVVEDILGEENISPTECHVVEWMEFMDRAAEAGKLELEERTRAFTEKPFMLTGEQADVLDKIARASGMDCWFSIGDDNTYIYDFENDDRLSLKEGIQTLYEGMTSYQDYEMTAADISVFEGLLNKMQIEVIKEELPLTPGITEPEKALGGMSRTEIEENVLCYAQAQLEDMGLSEDVKLLAARVYGSRTREGLYKEDSDVDVVLSYIGDIREDDFFSALHGEGMEMSGIAIDVNPISVEKTGTLEEYMENSENYLDMKELKKLAADLEQFSEDYDTYGYRDVLAGKEENIQMIYDDLISGRTGQLREWLEEIAADESGNLENMVKGSRDLLKRVDQAAEKGKISERGDIVKAPEEKEEPAISFYAAECMEFPVLGEYHDNLSFEEALKAYEKIPADRINGIKGIGFVLHDGSDYDGMEYELMSAGKLQEDMLDLVPYYKEHPLVQKAVAAMEDYLKKQGEAQKEENLNPKEQGTVMSEKKESMTADAQQKTGSKKESVLQALRNRQAKLKAQEQEKHTEKSHSKKKGEQEL